MTDMPAHVILEQHLALSGLSHKECWLAYFAMGGHSDQATLDAFLNGTFTLPQSEIDILAAAIGDHPQPGQQRPGSTMPQPPAVLELIDAGLMSDTSARLANLLRALDAEQPLAGIPILGTPEELDWRSRPGSPDPWQPVQLGDVSMVVDSERITAIHARRSRSPGGSSEQLQLASGSLLRVDAATSAEWEIHSTGDELLLLLAGKAHVEVDRSDSSIARLEHPYQACVIPRGRWHRHTATQTDTQLLYLTPLHDTQTSTEDDHR